MEEKNGWYELAMMYPEGSSGRETALALYEMDREMQEQDKEAEGK